MDDFEVITESVEKEEIQDKSESEEVVLPDWDLLPPLDSVDRSNL